MRINISNIISPIQIVLISLFIFVISFLIFKSVHVKSIQSKSNDNHLFLDSNYLENFISKQDSIIKYHSEYFDFYTQRNFKFAWFDTNGMTLQAHNFYNLQNELITNLDDSSIYNTQLQYLYERLLENIDSKKGIKDSITKKVELLLTGQYFRYATKTYHGSELNASQLGWYIPRKKLNIIEILDSLVDGRGTNTKREEPINRQYRLLEKQLAKYQNLQNNFKWDSIKVNCTYKIGDSSSVLPIIKNRLFLLGDYKELDTSIQFNPSMVLAVKNFQHRFGLPETGKIGSLTTKKLNISLQKLITKILINMERARWMPSDTSMKDRIVVNIPEYKLRVYDSGKYSFSMPVIVGTEAHNTVIFSENIRYIVFSPYWNVPTSITKNEVMPAMNRNRNYLTKHNMEVVKYNGQIPEIRQKPGLNNALGKVKFLFPNKYNIYLHDTPNKDAFLNSKRSFSHGCIRIGNPSGLAKFLLRRQPIYTADSILSLMNQTKEIWVDAKPHVQVIIKYFTAWVDVSGTINFREDIYGLDKKMQEKLIDIN